MIGAIELAFLVVAVFTAIIDGTFVFDLPSSILITLSSIVGAVFAGMHGVILDSVVHVFKICARNLDNVPL